MGGGDNSKRAGTGRGYGDAAGNTLGQFWQRPALPEDAKGAKRTPESTVEMIGSVVVAPFGRRLLSCLEVSTMNSCNVSYKC